MQPPGITRRRRPFLAPILLPALFLLVLAVLIWAGYRSATTTTVVLVRHAEKELGSIEDPPLSSEGEQRAVRLARMLGDGTGPGAIAAILVSDTRRARQTAAPLAERLRIAPTVVPAEQVAGRLAQLLRRHRGRTVLVIGHSNTVPALVERLAGVEVGPIGNDEYDDVYIVSIPSVGRPGLVRLKY